MDKALNDPRLEVRTVACGALAALHRGTARYLDATAVDALVARAMRLVRKKVPNATAGAAPMDTSVGAGSDADADADTAGPEATPASRAHGRVLRLEALVKAHPYDVPGAWMPAVLHELTRHSRAGVPVSTTVKGTLAAFWSTHQELWDLEFRELFTEEQADALRDCVVTPSYYA
eukprot:TRINITY_DN609_c1_g3_i1.p3 TRINITY_DN609_c1_g3~~TRINITY_DN609_c1_g3_i1.p3  ORF type:complete len:175 (-),score=80.35 TRINITY_DN609_c1_g3_i1:62-586(-)